MVFGLVEVFMFEQFVQFYDVNVVLIQCVNCVVLLYLCGQCCGLFVWVLFLLVCGGILLFFVFYFVVKVVMDLFVVFYVVEFVCWGIEMLIVVLGVFIWGMNYFFYVGKLVDIVVQVVYDGGLYVGVVDQVLWGFVVFELVDVDVGVVVMVIVEFVVVLVGKCFYCVFVDLLQDGVEEVFCVGDCICCEMFRNIGFVDLCVLCVGG